MGVAALDHQLDPVVPPSERSDQRSGSAGREAAGSHRQYRHADGRGTTVPFHLGQNISSTCLRKVTRDIGPTAEQLLRRG